MARKADDITEFLLKDIRKDVDVLEISSYLEEANYKLEDLEEILYRILTRYLENSKCSKKPKKRYLN